MDQPPFDRSPLDGYALRAADTAGACREHPVSLAVADTLYTGDAPRVPVAPGQAVRVMTGTMLPAPLPELPPPQHPEGVKKPLSKIL